MTVQKLKTPSVEELLKVTQQIELLIEDNNQNIKDCTRVLKEIKQEICPVKPSIIKSAILKLLNRSSK